MDDVTKRKNSEINDAPAPLDDSGPTPPPTPPVPPQTPPRPSVPPPPAHARVAASPSAHRQRSLLGDVDPLASQPDSAQTRAGAPNAPSAEEAAPPSEDRPRPPAERPAGEDRRVSPPGAERGVDPIAEAGQRPFEPFTQARPEPDRADEPTNEQRQTPTSTVGAPQRPGSPAGLPHATPGERTGVTDVFARRDAVPVSHEDPTAQLNRDLARPRPRAADTGLQRAGQPSSPARGGEASQQWGQGPPPRTGEQDRRAESNRSGDAAGPAGASWSYVDQIRTSELVPTRKIPPARGWRKAVLNGTFGLINPGQSPDERRKSELEAKIRSLLRGRYKIGVLGKGGTGKTTIAACVGSVFAQLRQEDRVVAIDADTAFGKLASRIDPNAAGSYWELATDQYLHTFADVRSRVGNNAAGLFVLAGEQSTARRRVLDPAIYREATARLDNHFTISLIDCGSTLDSPVTQAVLADLDALIVTSSPWVDGASAAGQTMAWLAHNGYTGLLHRTVVVLNDSDGHADKRTRQLLVEQFGSRGQVVVEVPFDAHLRPGGVIDVDNELGRVTRRRLIEIAAAIAEHFAATTDAPRERR
jgi:MinD-like ATPase involved in chromosome partitioning or flagellar assembly